MTETEMDAKASVVVDDVDVALRVSVSGESVRCVLECDGRKAVITFRPGDIDFDVELCYHPLDDD